MDEKIIFDEKQMAEKSIFNKWGKFIDIDGVETYVVEKGIGENIIFINGILASIYTWRKVLDTVSENFHVYAIDFKGTGFSEKPKGGYSIDICTSQIISLMKYFNIDKAILVGNSLGGEVALNLAIKHSEKINKLILIDSAGYQKNKEITKLLVKLGRFKLVAKLLERCNTKNFVRKIIRWATFNDKIIDRKMVNGYYKPMKTKGAVEAFIELVKNLSYTEFDYEKVKNIEIPTLIIWGKEDKWIPVSDAYRLHRDIKNSKLVILENCGHGPQEEKPEEIVRLIVDFAKCGVDNKGDERKL